MGRRVAPVLRCDVANAKECEYFELPFPQLCVLGIAGKIGAAVWGQWCLWIWKSSRGKQPHWAQWQGGRRSFARLTTS